MWVGGDPSYLRALVADDEDGFASFRHSRPVSLIRRDAKKAYKQHTAQRPVNLD